MRRRTTSSGYVANLQPYADGAHWEPANSLKFTAVDAMFAQEIFTDKLTVTKFRSIGSGDTKAAIEIADGVMSFIGMNGVPNITLGLDDDGCAVLKFYNSSGELQYDLGPAGINQNVTQEANRFVPGLSLAVCDNFNTLVCTTGLILHLHQQTTVSRFRFIEGFTKTGSVKTYNISHSSTPSSYNGKTYDEARNYTGSMIQPGWYITQEMEMSNDELTSAETMYSRRVYRVMSAGNPVLQGYITYVILSVGNDERGVRFCAHNGEPIAWSGKTLDQVITN